MTSPSPSLAPVLDPHRIIAVEGSVYVTVANHRLSATIHRMDTSDVYAVVHSAEEAEAVLTQGVENYELYVGGTDFWAASIAAMVSAIKRALIVVTVA